MKANSIKSWKNLELFSTFGLSVLLSLFLLGCSSGSQSPVASSEEVDYTMDYNVFKLVGDAGCGVESHLMVDDQGNMGVLNITHSDYRLFLEIVPPENFSVTNFYSNVSELDVPHPQSTTDYLVRAVYDPADPQPTIWMPKLGSGPGYLSVAAQAQITDGTATNTFHLVDDSDVITQAVNFRICVYAPIYEPQDNYEQNWVTEPTASQSSSLISESSSSESSVEISSDSDDPSSANSSASSSESSQISSQSNPPASSETGSPSSESNPAESSESVENSSESSSTGSSQSASNSSQSSSVESSESQTTSSETSSETEPVVSSDAQERDVLDICSLRADGKTIGFWKNNVTKYYAGVTKGIQISPSKMSSLIESIGSFGPQIFANLTAPQARAILGSTSSNPENLLQKQMLASQFNYWNQAYIDGDKEATKSFVLYGEELILAGGASRSELLRVKDLYDAYNNSHGGLISGPGCN